MTNTANINQLPELITKNNIIQLLEQLTVDYQNTKSERKAIAAECSAIEEEFTVLEEIELLTTDLRGYANQIKAIGYIKNEKYTIQNLQKIRIFNNPIIAQFYQNNWLKYNQITFYLQRLDYLRLLMLEYLTIKYNNQP